MSKWGDEKVREKEIKRLLKEREKISFTKNEKEWRRVSDQIYKLRNYEKNKESNRKNDARRRALRREKRLKEQAYKQKFLNLSEVEEILWEEERKKHPIIFTPNSKTKYKVLKDMSYKCGSCGARIDTDYHYMSLHDMSKRYCEECSKYIGGMFKTCV